jgi:hypothetical protein
MLKQGQQGINISRLNVILNSDNKIKFIETFFFSSLNITQGYWIRDLSYCPRKREATRQRQCFKSCFDDSDCRSRYRSCVCDYDCGMSCVKRGEFIAFL